MTLNEIKLLIEKTPTHNQGFVRVLKGVPVKNSVFILVDSAEKGACTSGTIHYLETWEPLRIGRAVALTPEFLSAEFEFI